MGKPITYLGAMCTGHNGFPPRPNIGASSNVFVEGRAVHRQGDPWSIHCRPRHGCHGGSLSGGSSTVFVNHRGAGRLGDSVSCGSKVAQACSTVFAG